MSTRLRASCSISRTFSVPASSSRQRLSSDTLSLMISLGLLGKSVRSVCRHLVSPPSRRLLRLMLTVFLLAGQDIASRCHGLPSNHLVTLSSHPQAKSIHTKRQMIAPDMQEIEDALERITETAQQEDASGIDKSQAQDWDLDDYLASEGRPAVDYQQQQQQPSASARPTALPKNAALVEKYAIVSPNLVFAIGLFLIVFLPLGIYSVQALAAMSVFSSGHSS